MTRMETSNWVLFKENCNRQSAPEELHKIKKANKEKLGRKSNHTGSSKGTHTTLRCCFACHVANPQKSGVLGPRQDCRGRLKALPWVQNAYGACLLLPYISNLNSRPPLPLSNAQGLDQWHRLISP